MGISAFLRLFPFIPLHFDWRRGSHGAIWIRVPVSCSIVVSIGLAKVMVSVIRICCVLNDVRSFFFGGR